MKRFLKWFFGLLLLAILVLVGLFIYTIMPQNIDVPLVETNHAFAPGKIAEPPVGVEVSLMKTGKMLSQEAFSWRGGTIGKNYDFGMVAVVIKHPTKGMFLFDAGFGENVQKHRETIPWLMQKLATIETETPAAKQLLSAGITKDKINAIYISHSHWDHVSGIEDFPGTEIRMPRAELDFVKSGKYPGLINDWIDKLNVKTFAFDGGPYENFDSSSDVFGDGSVVLVPMPGHTDGSTGMFVNLASGKRYFFTGDLTWSLEGFQLPAERPWLARKLVDFDEENVRNAIGKVHTLMKKYPEMVIVPAHDRRQHDKMKAFPVFER